MESITLEDACEVGADRERIFDYTFGSIMTHCGLYKRLNTPKSLHVSEHWDAKYKTLHVWWQYVRWRFHVFECVHVCGERNFCSIRINDFHMYKFLLLDCANCTCQHNARFYCFWFDRRQKSLSIDGRVYLLSHSHSLNVQSIASVNVCQRIYVSPKIIFPFNYHR